MQTARLFRRVFLWVALPVIASSLLPTVAWCAQLHPVEVSASQETEMPYRLTGQLNVTFGHKEFFGTATFIRRFTGITAGHLLYDPDDGLAVSPYVDLDLFQGYSADRITVASFAVLSGYQGAANNDPDSNAAFDYDMGYLLFASPEPHAEWAAFGPATDALTTDQSFLVFGYAAENYSGDTQAYVNIESPFAFLQSPGLYENDTYYTEGGMSGGPLYVSNDGVMQVAAVTVAGTSRPDPPLSDVRAITTAEQTMFTEAEYVNGYIKSGIVKGPASVPAGATAKFKTGVVFKDGVQERRDLPARYDEIYLKAVSAHKHLVSISKIRTGKFKVKFSSDLVSGDVVTLRLFRNTLPKSEQTPLQEIKVTVQ